MQAGTFPAGLGVCIQLSPGLGKGRAGRGAGCSTEHSRAGKNFFPPSHVCEAAPQSQPKKTPEEEGWEVLRANRPWPWLE